jgi:[FeFe] hydrogenase H-cluster maturation GTPase HydF
MQSAPKSLRIQIAIFGRTNVGKSSFLNQIAGQDVSVVSDMPGVTTDLVEKQIELLPIGPVNFIDAPGLDDVSELGEKRIVRAKKALNRADIAALVLEAEVFTDTEKELIDTLKKKNIPFLFVINKTDIKKPSESFIKTLSVYTDIIIETSSINIEYREDSINKFKSALSKLIPSANGAQNLPLLGDLLPSGALVVLVTPIDLQAPKGRMIMPQVQAIRDALDNDDIVMVVKEKEYAAALAMLNKKPDLVVCDSQVVFKTAADTPNDVKMTTFSILFSRLKGDLIEEVRGVKTIDELKVGDKILIAEACSHHSLEDDIGKVKIPRWLRQYLGFDAQIDFCNGRDFPDNLSEYKLVIHCGACMITRQEKLSRMRVSQEAGVPITNYGMTISLTQGYLKRALSPFPAALEIVD